MAEPSPGRGVGAVVWQVLLSAGTYLVSHQLRHSSSLYGVFGVVLGLIAWLYLQAEVTLYAAEINVVLVKRLWPRALAVPPYTKADREAHLMYSVATQRDRAETLRGRPRPVNDSWIAACCLAHGLPLAIFNTMPARTGPAWRITRRTVEHGS